MPKEPELNSQLKLRNQIMQGLGFMGSMGTWMLGELNTLQIGDKIENYDATLTNEEKRFLFQLRMGNNVARIGKDFANGARHLRTLRLSENLTEIPEGAFAECTKLRLFDNFKNMQKLTAIRENAFANTNLREIPALDNLMFIENGAFADCSHLRHLNFSENSNIRVIGDNAFDGCKRLVDQNKAMFGGRGKFGLPKNLEVIGAGAFGGCKKIKKLEIGDSVRQINGNPFGSPNYDYKKDGKMKLGARWRNWHSKIYIEGLNKPLRGKYFEGMDTTIDGLRHIQYNGRHHIEVEKGKFTVLDNVQYEAWKNQKENDLVAQVQVTPEAFVAYLHKRGIEIEPEKVSLANLNTFNRGKEDSIKIRFGANHEPLEINVLEIKQFTADFNRMKQAEEIAQKKAEELAQKEAEDRKLGKSLNAHFNMVDETIREGQYEAEDLAQQNQQGEEMQPETLISDKPLTLPPHENIDKKEEVTLNQPVAISHEEAAMLMNSGEVLIVEPTDETSTPTDVVENLEPQTPQVDEKSDVLIDTPEEYALPREEPMEANAHLPSKVQKGELGIIEQPQAFHIEYGSAEQQTPTVTEEREMGQ